MVRHSVRSNDGTIGVPMTITVRVEKADDRVEEKKRSKSSQLFGEIANVTSGTAGRAPTFVAAVAVVLIWAVTGPLFGLRHLAFRITKYRGRRCPRRCLHTSS